MLHLKYKKLKRCPQVNLGEFPDGEFSQNRKKFKEEKSW